MSKSCMALVRLVLPFHAAAWKASSNPIQALLDTTDPVKQDGSTGVWRDTTQSQLNAVGITSALIGGVVTSAFSWPVLAAIDASNRATVSALWYSALLLALGSIASAAQQAVALSRLSSHPEGLRKIREVLGRKKVNGRWRPSKVQLIIWQTPVSMLNASIVIFVVGFSVLVWASVDWRWAWDDVKVVTVFMVTLLYTVVLYSVTAFGLYRKIAQV